MFLSPGRIRLQQQGKHCQQVNEQEGWSRLLADGCRRTCGAWKVQSRAGTCYTLGRYTVSSTIRLPAEQACKAHLYVLVELAQGDKQSQGSLLPGPGSWVVQQRVCQQWRLYTCTPRR